MRKSKDEIGLAIMLAVITIMLIGLVAYDWWVS